MSICYLLIGLPGSGKSTLTEQLLKDMPTLTVVSTDQYIEEYAKKVGKKYNEVYRSVDEDAKKWMNNLIKKLIREKKPFIWDQTNVYLSARTKKLNMLTQNNYEVIAVALNLSEEELNKRLNKRSQEGGKFISPKIIQEMKVNYTLPSYNEKFKEIYLINDLGNYVKIPAKMKI